MHVPQDRAAGASRTIKASELEAKCLQLMDHVAQSGEEIVITKNGLPISRLAPYRAKPKSLFGIDRGRIEILSLGARERRHFGLHLSMAAYKLLPMR